MRTGALAFSAADLASRMRLAGPGGEETRLWGDQLLNPDLVQLAERVATRDAAVLVPIVDHGDDREAGVVLTTRASHLRKHSGQISFPGGSLEPADDSPEAAALREAAEEIALEPRFVRPIGRLPRYATLTGFRITPVVGIVSPGFRLSPDPHEVADAFEVPLGFLMDEANHLRESRIWNEVPREHYTMPFGERRIWGITAGIIRTLYERFYAP